MLSWGANSYGQLGQGHKDDVHHPKEVMFNDCDNGVTCVAGGGGHTCIVTGHGSIWSCGSNEKGQLGLQHGTGFTKLERIMSLTMVKISKVACGWDFTMAITCDGQLFAWGSNYFGQLGHPEYKNYPTPLPVEHCVGKHVSDVAAGLRHSAVICSKEVCCFGSNKKGQMGGITLIEKTSNAVPAPIGEEFIQVKCGAYNTFVMTVSGKVYGWGSNNKGQLAVNPKVLKYSTEPCMLPITDVRQVHSGWTHVIILNNKGELISWGRGDYGQLGRECPSVGYCYIPQICSLAVPVTKFSFLLVCYFYALKITGGAEHNIALTSDNAVWAWGWNEHGMCGLGHVENILYPTVVSLPEHTGASVLGCGSGHSFVVITT